MQHAAGYAFQIQDTSARWYLFVLATELGGYVLRRPGTKFSKVPGYLRVPEYTLLDTDKYAIEHEDSCLITEAYILVLACTLVLTKFSTRPPQHIPP